MMKKLKHWLIKKLGGYTDADLPRQTIQFKTVEPVTVYASTAISLYELLDMSAGEANMYAKEELARNLAKQIIYNNLCVIERTEDYIIDRAIFKTSIKVIPTLREDQGNGWKRIHREKRP